MAGAIDGLRAHVFDDELIVVNYRSLLRRNRIVVSVRIILIANERHTLRSRSITISDIEMAEAAHEVSFT